MSHRAAPDGVAGGPAESRPPILLGMLGGGHGSAVGVTHRDAAAMDGRFSLRAGMFSADPQRGRAFGTAIGIDPARCYGDVAALIAGEAARPDGVQAVAVVTPNHLHAPAVRALLAAGLHVICEKPMTTSLADALALRALARERGRVLALAHAYAGYAMVHEARALVADGAIGPVVAVQAEYVSGWGETLVERAGAKGAVWRTDPAQAGPSTVVGDLGTHAHHLARFVTGLEVAEVAAELSTLVPGRSADDNAHLLLRFDNGARGMLWATMAAAGAGNGLRLRVFGRRGHLEWHQEQPDHLHLRPLDGPVRTYRRAMAGAPVSAGRERRRPGHPEGVVDAFAGFYRDVAAHIRAAEDGRAGDLPPLPDADDGVAGMAFIEAVVRSSRADGRWTRVEAGIGPDTEIG